MAFTIQRRRTKTVRFSSRLKSMISHDHNMVFHSVFLFFLEKEEHTFLFYTALFCLYSVILHSLLCFSKLPCQSFLLPCHYRMEEMRQETVCVTGAGGFIASWIVNKLLSKGYTVKGAVRNPDDGKYKHLRKLEGAKKRLQLVKADILDYQSLIEVLRGCDGVFHTACHLTDDPDQVIKSAVKGTVNVLDACAEWGVKRLVMTSSFGAVYMDPNRDPHLVVDENCWSDLDYCIQTKNWYCYAKTVAEKEAWKQAEKRNLDMVVVIPCLVLGPLLQPSINASTAHIMKYLTGSAKTYANLTQAYVDVRDVAEAHILVYETPSACGRYLCAESSMHRGELVALLAQLLPQYPLPLMCSDQNNPRKQAYKFSNEKIRALGLTFTPMNKYLCDTVASLHNMGFLHLMSPL